MGKTSIEWADFTFNPWLGCTEVSPACDHCYARVMMADRYGRVKWGAGEDRVRTSPENWKQPLRWDRIAQADGSRPTVFCLSLGDIWDNEVDPRWRRDLFALIEKTPHLTWLLLSKRIGNAIKMANESGGLPSNAAVGATMVNQKEWDRDVGDLLYAKRTLNARFSFASIEPMLGSVEMGSDVPDWTICGGESGPHARPMHPEWVRSLRDQCAAANVPFFMKQWGEWRPHADDFPRNADRAGIVFPNGTFKTRGLGDASGEGGADVFRAGKKAAGRLLDGREHNATPFATEA